jgi:hypothetical protein
MQRRKTLPMSLGLTAAYHDCAHAIVSQESLGGQYVRIHKHQSAYEATKSSPGAGKASFTRAGSGVAR